ncbi:ABC transporter permease subunit [Clostridium sp. MCC353]|uniref:carbohydrate ABC transporter permease n=1 Tax=Clostridium sp. MCC353 TaxID=2592646 RepID=UPI001C030876|nr:sugar ABC transporter permease [Clostridium sp. MCC353]MBT9778708.1 ABC transporter permease subunit [Clostridium sp. MCC353]
MNDRAQRTRVPFWRNIKVVPYLYILPNMILFFTFMIVPIIMSFYYSTVKWNGMGKPKFIDIQNYLYIFHDKVFIKSIFNTIYYTAATVPILMVLALFFAVLLNSKIPLRGIIRSSIYAPAVVSTVAVGTVFTWIFQDQLGLINYIITSLGGTAIKWANDPRFAMIMLIMATVWQRTGYNMVIYLAGLQGIPTEMMEAATIDGANTWQKFRFVTLPLLKNTHMFVMITCMINAFRSFDLVYTMTQGGPLNSTKTIVMYVYEQAFAKNYYGRAAAAGIVLFVFMVVLTAIRFKIEKED